MALKSHKLAAAITVAAAFSMLETPVSAAELPRPAAVKVYDGEAGNVNRDRRWRRHRDRVDAGDVIAGVLILGTIAAIAGAAKDRRERGDRYPTRYPYPDGPYRGGVDYRSPSDDGRYQGGMNRAVDMCVAEVERGGERVGSVDAATRNAEGWQVSGALEGGSAYSCNIDNSGRISGVGGSGSAYGEPSGDGQWEDDTYTRAREDQGYSYPEGDGRYDASQVPDFE